ncbi:hypothetical protein EI94DRAFT_1300222 [Lactarius quietus]|nr:hypothetical protein EI94DRAFT_1300222 [Lactarius quietus]
MNEHHVLTRSLQPVDVFAIIPLHQEPIFSGTNTRRGRPMWLLDPLDMLPFIFEMSTRDAGSDGVPSLQKAILPSLASLPWQLEEPAFLSQNRDPLHWWRKISTNVVSRGDINVSLAEELSSSHIWQRAVYENPPPCPTISSSAIQWEQSIVEGHPTHPFHPSCRMIRRSETGIFRSFALQSCLTRG